MPAKDHLLLRAKEFAYSGRQADARRLVLALLKDEPDNEAAWLCYGETFPDFDDRLRVYERALQQGAEMPRIRRTIRQIVDARQLAPQVLVPVSGIAAPAMPTQPGNSFLTGDREKRKNQSQNSGEVWRPNVWNSVVGYQPVGLQQTRLQKKSPEQPDQPALKRVISLALLGLFILVAIFTLFRQYQLTQNLIRSTLEAEIVASQLQDEVAVLLNKIQLLQNERANLTRQLVVEHDNQAKTLSDLSRVAQDLQESQVEYERLTARYQELEGSYTNLQTEHQHLAGRNTELQAEYENLVGAYNLLAEQKSTLEHNYSQLQAAYAELENSSIRPPFIAVSDRTAHLAFRRTNNTVQNWDFPFELLEESIEVGFLKRGFLKLPFNQLTLKTSDGATYHAPDFRVFIDPEPFKEVIGQIYRESPNDYAFLNEVWFIVAQLTTYSGEFYEVPRMPLETLLAGGGDCEDTSILFASMIKAAPVDWEVSIVLMNGINPYNRNNPNHVAVKVDTGAEMHIVETTNHEKMEPYNNGEVDAWFFEIH